MLEFLGGAFVSAGIIFLVVLLWVGVQGVIRRTEALPPDCDVIADAERGCTQCNLRDNCAARPKENTR